MPGFLSNSSWFFLSLYAQLFYIVVGVGLYCVLIDIPDGFSLKPDDRTNRVVDGLYFVLITLCSIGYGDIAPTHWLTRAVFGIYGWFGNALTLHFVKVLEDQLKLEFDNIPPNAENTKWVRFKKFLGSRKVSKIPWVLGFFLIVGVIGVLATEYKNLEDSYSGKILIARIVCVVVDAFYLLTSTYSTIGYGDVNFKSVWGRTFAFLYMPAATYAHAHCLLLLIETCANRGPAWTRGDSDVHVDRSIQRLRAAPPRGWATRHLRRIHDRSSGVAGQV